MKKRQSFLIIILAFILFVTATIPQIGVSATGSDDYVLIKASDWGITENTAHDDRASAEANTAAIQNAIDTLYAQGYRKMRLETMDITIWGAHPWGDSTWGGNPYENHETGVVMRTGMSFDMNGSTFRLATNDRPRYCLIMIGVPATEYIWDPVNKTSSTGPTQYTTDVEIFGGTLIGDRWTHDYWQDGVADTQNPDGTWISTHEFGMGISVGSNAERTKIHNMIIKDITGDCIGIGGKDTEIYNCDISYGRRNGICSAGAEGIKIYNNHIHDIWNDVVIPNKTHNQSTLTDYQKKMGVTYGIGAEACIAFEGGKGIFNVEIYNNFLNGHSESPYTQGDAINFHWGTMGIHVYDNIINGDIAQVQGSNIIIEGNKLFNGGYSVSGGTTTYNGHLVDESDPKYLGGRSDNRNCIFIDNYCYNYGIYTRAPIKPGYEDYPGQENGTNLAFIGNYFVNGKLQAHTGIRTAYIGNLLHFEERDTGSGFWLCLQQEPINKGNNNGTFLYAFHGNLVQLIEDGTWNYDTPGIRYSRTYSDAGSGYANLHRIQLENKDALSADEQKAITDVYPWYRETDDTEEITAFLSGFKIMGPYNLPVWTDWYNKFLSDADKWYSINDGLRDLPLYNGTALPGGYTPPYILEQEIERFFTQIYKGPVVDTPGQGSPVQDYPPVDIEKVKSFVTRLYELILGREPDLNGLSEWVQLLAAREMTGAQVAYGFFFSEELAGQNLDNESFIVLLYRALMGREPDTDGLTGWTSLAVSDDYADFNREKLFQGFVMSVEFNGFCIDSGIERGEYWHPTSNDTEGFVIRAYNLCLGRYPGDTEMQDWIDKLKTGKETGTGIVLGFINSPEFLSKKLSDREYVEVLYNVFLGRPSDPGGRADWIGRLATQSRDQILQGIAGSQEFTGICAEYSIKP